MCASIHTRARDSPRIVRGARLRVRERGWLIFQSANNNEKSAPRCLGLGNGAIRRKLDETLLSVKRTPKYVNRPSSPPPSGWRVEARIRVSTRTYSPSRRDEARRGETRGENRNGDEYCNDTIEDRFPSDHLAIF